MRLLTLLVLCLVLLPACSTGSSSMQDLVGSRYGLTDLKLETERIQNLGRLPTFDPPLRGSQTVPPYAVGTFAINEQRQVVCTVTGHDPVTGANGQVNSFNHDLVRFTGLLNPDGSSARVLGIEPKNAPLGYPTTIRFAHLSDQRVEVRTFTGEVELPYVYIFRKQERPRPVAMPYYVP